MRASQTLHRFEIDLQIPTQEDGVRAANSVGEAAGRVDLRWMIIPDDFPANPDREPPPTLLDPSRSQRLAMQEINFTFGQDGFRGFGTGRTFPVWTGGQAKLLAAAVGNITEGLGKFRGHEGNFVLCGELNARQGFLGHVVARVVDEQGGLLTQSPLPPLQPQPNPEPGITYLVWAANKGAGPEQENRPSFTPEGQVRGLNIPLLLKRAHFGFAADEGAGFQSSGIRTGEEIGLEIGFGRGSQPDAPPTGTPLSPFQFEGVAQYSFHDAAGKDVGAFTTNVVEGRRFDMRFSNAPGEQAWRFGFFGPIILGTGCFRGARGMFYGVSTSFFKPPPDGAQVITHLYFTRLYDPDGRFRTAIAGD